MEISTLQLPFRNPDQMTEDAYLEAVEAHFGAKRITVPSNGSCFFDSVYALLPTVGKAVKSSYALRDQVVSFFRECQSNQHDLLGERVIGDLENALLVPIVSSYAATRGNNRKPKNIDAYLEAVSKRSVWVEGVHLVLFVFGASRIDPRIGFHWLRAIAHLYSVMVVVTIHGWSCVYTFGEMSYPVIRLWKCDVETHFEPLIPDECKCTLPAIHITLSHTLQISQQREMIRQ